MERDDLTPKQRQILAFIRSQTESRGYPPSVREIGEAFRLKSTSTVHGHLTRLERKGYIRRDPSKPRAIELLRPAMSASMGDHASGKPAPARVAQWVPLVGRVTAGEPILAVENIDEWIPLAAGFFSGEDGQLFALRVRGDSMVGAGILDGDVVIVRRQDTADDGSIVVALIDDEATVKRVYRQPGALRLEPANEAYPPIITPRARILGKVVGLFRHLG